MQLKWLPSSSSSLTLPFDGVSGWLLVNVNQTGFYRVNYEDAMWRRLTQPRALKRLSPANRAQIINDAMDLVPWMNEQLLAICWWWISMHLLIFIFVGFHTCLPRRFRLGAVIWVTRWRWMFLSPSWRRKTIITFGWRRKMQPSISSRDWMGPKVNIMFWCGVHESLFDVLGFDSYKKRLLVLIQSRFWNSIPQTRMSWCG